VGEQKRSNPHLVNKNEAEFVALRNARDKMLPMPNLILHALQVNITGGRLPDPEANGTRYLEIPLNALAGEPENDLATPEPEASMTEDGQCPLSTLASPFFIVAGACPCDAPCVAKDDRGGQAGGDIGGSMVASLVRANCLIAKTALPISGANKIADITGFGDIKTLSR
jgi:hypothetical protein